jgi:hypothetical protein
MRVVMILLAAHCLLLLHLDASEVIDEPLDFSLVFPGEDELRVESHRSGHLGEGGV